MGRDRRLNLNVRVTELERRKLHALATDRDLSVSDLLGHHIREAYIARFGTQAPPEPATTTNDHERTTG